MILEKINYPEDLKPLSIKDKEILSEEIREKILEKLQIPYSIKVASAHRTHDKVKKLVIDATKEGVEVFIGIAGLAAHLPGAIAAYTHRPVIGVPVKGAVEGLDSLYSCAQMPFPTPVLTVGVGRGDNAAILAGGTVSTHIQMGIGDGLIPKVLNQNIYEEIAIITDEEALQTAKDLARLEGLMCGISSGTNVAAAIKLAKKLGPGKTVVTVLPDTAERYFSTPLFDE